MRRFIYTIYTIYTVFGDFMEKSTIEKKLFIRTFLPLI